MKEIIKKYVDNLTKKDIIDFSNKEKIHLNNKEIDIIFNTIKNDYNILIDGDAKIIFLKLKEEINEDAFFKIFDLYKKYKNFI